MAAIKAGSLRLGIHISIGDANPVEVGQVSVPLELRFNGDQLVADVKGVTDTVRELIRQSFAEDAADGGES